MCQVKTLNQFDSIIELMTYFKDEKTCLKYLEQWLHGGNIHCPHCGFQRIFRFKDGKRFRCYGCKEQFTAKIGTIFESSRLPMLKWYMAIYLISSDKKGISSYQLAKYLKVTQKTSWFMLHRIRTAMKQDESQLHGVVMSDESFIGGKNKNRHIDKKVKNSQGRSFKDKVPVLGLMQAEVSHTIERPHKVISGKMVDEKVIVRPKKLSCTVIESTKKESLQPEILKKVEKGSTFISDEWKGYAGLNSEFDHQIVDHTKLQFLTKEGHSTNAMEGAWTHLKKSIVGCYHRVSKKHLHRYLNESVFRYNTIQMKEGERMNELIKMVKCRLTYKQLTQKVA